MTTHDEDYAQFVAEITRLIVDDNPTIVPFDEWDRDPIEGDPVSGDHLTRYQAELS